MYTADGPRITPDSKALRQEGEKNMEGLAVEFDEKPMINPSGRSAQAPAARDVVNVPQLRLQRPP